MSPFARNQRHSLTSSTMRSTALSQLSSTLVARNVVRSAHKDVRCSRPRKSLCQRLLDVGSTLRAGHGLKLEQSGYCVNLAFDIS